MPDPDLSYANYTGIVTGWGLTEEGGALSNTPQKVHVPALSVDICKRVYRGRITDNMMCARELEGGRGPCQGDSGGPLHIFNNNTDVYQEIVNRFPLAHKKNMPYKLLLICSLAIAIRAQTPEATETVDSVAHDKGILDWISNILRPATTTTLRPHEDPPEDCPSCKCGVPYTTRRIVGGFETEVNEFPWMALLMYRERFYCGGALINDLYVATAAHCTVGFVMQFIKVRFLEHDQSLSNETNTTDRNVVAIIRHLLYNPVNYDNDIALLKMDQRIILSNALKKTRRIYMRKSADKDSDDDENETEEEYVGIWPVCMPDPDLSYTNYTGIVTGWGLTEEGGAPSNTLQEVLVPVLSDEVCKRTYQGRITDNMLCAGELEGGRDSCQGDSGGPLHIFNNDTDIYQEIGIVSWGEGCARPESPGVYTRVNRYLAWIRRNTKDACYCD